MGFLDTLKNLVPASRVSYVRNPNYNPNDSNSKRYVDTNQAQEEAQKRAQFTNDLFSITGDNSKLVQPTQFFNPNNAKLNVGADPLAQFRLNQPNNGIGAGLSLNSQGRVINNNPQNAGGASDKLTDLSIQLANGARQPVQTPGGGVATNVGTSVPGIRTDNMAALAAQAGLSLSEYKQLLADQSLSSGEQIDEIRNELGIPDLIDDAFKKPDTSSIDMYRELYKELGLEDIKGRIAEFDDTLNKRREDLVEAAGAIKNNPWLSQGSRTGRLRILNELASADISNILTERQQALDLYDDGVNEIERQVGFALSDQAEDRQLTVDQLNFMLGEAERRQDVQERNALTEGLRNVPDFLGQSAREELLSGSSAAGFTVTGSGDPSKMSTRAQAVYNNPSLLDNYTPTEKGKIIDELAANNLNLESFTTNDLSGAARSQIAQFDDLVRQGQQLDVLINEVGLNTGPISSRAQATGAAVGIGDTADFTNYRSIIDNMGSALLKLRSGAAVTPQEFERIKGFIPGLNDPEETAKLKIKNFYTEIAAARKNFVLRGTQTTGQIRESVGIGTGAEQPSGVQPTPADNAYVNSLPL